MCHTLLTSTGDRARENDDQAQKATHFLAIVMLCDLFTIHLLRHDAECLVLVSPSI